MKKITHKITAFLMAIMMGIGIITPAIQNASVYATSPATTFGAEAAILKDCAKRGENDDQNGDGIICVVEFVIDIFSILIGIAGVIGVVWAGIQYMTAGGNEEKTRKAKRRLFEIVLGVAAYAVGYALLKWLLPGSK